MIITITEKATGKSQTGEWSKMYGFLYSLNRSERADFAVTTEDGRDVTKAAFNAASKAGNAVRNGYRPVAAPVL